MGDGIKLAAALAPARKYLCGLVRMEVWLKPRGKAAIDLVTELMEWRADEIIADTSSGVFVILRDGIAGDHGREFYEWCKQ